MRSRITSPRWSIDVWISPENPCSFAYESTCALISSRFDCSSAACCFSAAFWAGDFGATLPIRLCDMIWKVESICWLAVADWTPWMRVGSPCWKLLPPSSTPPMNAFWRARWSTWYLEMFTDEIDNRTMNSAMSSVIMSA